MGLIRRLREGTDSWGARLEKQRKARHPGAKKGKGGEKDALRMRKMFGKVFLPKTRKLK